MSAKASDKETIMDQAQHIWAMLDDLANSDQDAYKRFIDKHVREGKESMKAPEPHMCIQTVILTGDSNSPLYINVCAWPRVPAPDSNQSPIPTLGGKIYGLKDGQDGGQAIAIGFNPTVLEECGRDAGLPKEQQLLVNLCLDYIESRNNVKLSRCYSVLPHKQPYRGTLHQIRQTLLAKTQDYDQKFEEDLGQLEKSFAPLNSGLKDSLLNQLSNITLSESNHLKQTMPENGTEQSEIKLLPEANPPKQRLIEEMDSSPGSKELPEPEYNLQFEEGDGEKPERIVLRVALPGVKSVDECELDISQEDVSLVVPGNYKLHLSFPALVDVPEARAKFSKKATALSVFLPIIAAISNDVPNEFSR